MNKKMLGVLALVVLAGGFHAANKGFAAPKRYRMEDAVRRMYPGRSESFIQNMIAKQKQHRYDMDHYSPGETTYEGVQKKGKGRFGSLKSKFGGFKSSRFKKYF